MILLLRCPSEPRCLDDRGYCFLYAQWPVWRLLGGPTVQVGGPGKEICARAHSVPAHRAARVSSAILARTLNGQHWRRTSFTLAVFFPGVVFGTGFLVNFIIWGKHSSAAVPFTTVRQGCGFETALKRRGRPRARWSGKRTHAWTASNPQMIVLLLLWFCVSVPLVMAGFYFGYRKAPLEFPSKVNFIPREVPEQVWYLRLAPSMLLAGLLPFGAVFIELFFILSVRWFGGADPERTAGQMCDSPHRTVSCGSILSLIGARPFGRTNSITCLVSCFWWHWY